ncbi:MAG: transaldolase [Pseudomonadales bacterium]|nr:transaldolase [Pseudomonadales bacterium]
MINKLEQLKGMTDVVADTGDIDAIIQYKPLDATTNPSLLLKASSLDRYSKLLDRAVATARNTHTLSSDEQLSDAATRLAVDIGTEILGVIPGRISTEVDARLSFDTRRTIEQARKIIRLYNQAGFSTERVLIKVAATWEGIRAAEVLEKEGINCNLTLLFSFMQAAACADAGAFLISPFVGRILDWHKKDTGRATFPGDEDPGVISVKRIFHYYKHHGYKTVVMGASFRNKEEIESLAGCDRLTIGPQFLRELEEDKGVLTRQLFSEKPESPESIPDLGEANFRYQVNDDAMATEKLAEGIRLFVADQLKLEALLKTRQ